MNTITAHCQYVQQHSSRANHEYKAATDPQDSPFQLGVDSELDFWSWLKADQNMGQRFNRVMPSMASEWKTALDLYPVREKLIDGFQGGVLMVDMGGGLGHDLEAFHTKYPVESAEYVLQDVPDVLDAANPQPPIKKMAHDFFTEQPLKGAPIICRLHGPC